MVVNLLIGIAEDQDHLEKYFDKRTKQTYGNVSTKNGKMKLKKKGVLVDYHYGSDHSIVSQLNKCLKFKSIQGDRDHCTP